MNAVAVASFPNEIEARLGAQRLAAAGIRCVVVPLSYGPGVWGTSAMLLHELRVLESEVDQARQVLQEPAETATQRRRRFRRHRPPGQV